MRSPLTSLGSSPFVTVRLAGAVVVSLALLFSGSRLTAQASVCTIERFAVRKVEGRVLSVTGRTPLSEAVVELSDESTKRFVARVQSDLDGWFRFGRLPRGTYRLRATSQGFVLLEAVVVVSSRADIRRRLVVALGLDHYLACGGGRVEAILTSGSSRAAPN